MSLRQRQLFIATGVLLLHLAALWALQSGLMHRMVQLIVPGEVLSTEFVQPAASATPQAVAPARTAPRPLAPPEPMPVMEAAPLPAPAPTESTTAPASDIPVSPVIAAAPAPIRVELPSSDAAYLNNPKPGYPALSRRLGEQGKVVVRVLIDVDGRAHQAQLRSSSGYERLDQAALATVLSWRYVPGKRGGVPEAMSYDVPIHFVLE